ncbi:ubiquitin carboxyl-terminal hydrolase 37-like isoform X2 [Brienomyrus brachyistius]|uniref:ubiquitin carboxyl-terminal hydrolase 37-like isoform X2 n=1 Tax=Brienomyrus brachyistius TaxID=42636 RepID=UPI0020B3B1DB|nr:ubiquitin carboxyl-terminal hydrolase 37-like isoform X2 [Brienomyrus brachyistius]
MKFMVSFPFRRKQWSDGQPPRHRYQLVGILSHLGSSTISGHYISDTFTMEEKGWLAFSDHIVTRSDEEQVLRKRKSSAYMLFYTQQESLH